MKRKFKPRQNFNSRSREGSDRNGGAAGSDNADFNSRSREGSDTGARAKCFRDENFNSRSREGSDHIQSLTSHIAIISIHAPVKERPKIGSISPNLLHSSRSR